jgi:putative restriction endonuclease
MNSRGSRGEQMSDLAQRLAVLGHQHREALKWFQGRQGTEVSWPQPTPEGLFLVNKAKGIHKPSGWKYALSVRQSLGGPYADRDLITHSDGSWELEYYQEGHDPGKRDKDFTNRALLSNMEDGVPVGVFLQTQRKPISRYRVAGLAVVHSWARGYFRLRGLAGDGSQRSMQASTPTMIIAEAIGALPTSLTDARKRMNTAIVVRQGAGKFRARALEAFGNKCAITRFDVPDSLEAAHIVPYLGPDTDMLSNTLLLRADLHTLFDRDLLAIDPSSLTVRLSPTLLSSSYASLEGARVYLPDGDVGSWRTSLGQRMQPLLQ